MPFEVVKDSTRGNIFDRAAVFSRISFAGNGVVPHAATSRATYTAPAGKNAKVTSSLSAVVRATVAGTVGRAMAWNRHVTGTTNFITSAWIRTNVIGDKDSSVIGEGGYVLAGEEVNIITEDLAVTGTMDYRCAVTLLEYNQ